MQSYNTLGFVFCLFGGTCLYDYLGTKERVSRSTGVFKRIQIKVSSVQCVQRRKVMKADVRGHVRIVQTFVQRTARASSD